MSLITYTELCEEIQKGLIRAPIDNPAPFNTVPLEHVNAASVDVRLGRVFYEELRTHEIEALMCSKCHYPFYHTISLVDKDPLDSERVELNWGEVFLLEPGEFILTHTLEEFYLPNHIAAEFRLKSSVARVGLDQALAVWCDPGWQGSVLTIELRNNTRYHTLELTVGMKIGQMVFFKGEPVPSGASYAIRGQYNNDKEVTQSKGVK